MKDDFDRVIEEAIKLELYVADLYLLFHRIFPEDSHFWWALAIEEQNHAALLKTVHQMSRSELKIPGGIIPEELEELVHTNNGLQQAYEEFETHPDRIGAFQFAFDVENSAGEQHYESFMKYGADSRLKSLFLKLNGDDINHAERIRQYMIKHQIPE